MANTFLQVRVNEEDKAKASAILEDLGTNLSAVVNMLIKQIILTEGIPFDIRKNTTSVPLGQAAAYTSPEYDRETVSDPVIEGIKEEYEM